MIALAHGAAGLAVALSLGVLLTPRLRAAAALCGVQALVVAVAALAQRHPATAAVQLVFAAAIPVVAARLPQHAAAPGPRPPSMLAGGALAGGALATLAVTLPGDGLALAIVLVGALVVALRRWPPAQVLGLVSMQNGVALAAVAIPAHAAVTLIAVLPVVPLLAAASLWVAIASAGIPAPKAWSASFWIDPIGCAAVLAVACVLPWQVPLLWPPFRVDPFAAHMILVLAIVATAASWAAQRNATSPPGTRVVLLLATALAVVTAVPLLSWLALALATLASGAAALPRRAEAWRRVCLGSLGLSLAALGIGTLPVSNPWSPACIIVGLGTLAWLGPELTFAAVAIIVRQHAVADHAPAQAMLLIAGLAAMAVSGVGLLQRGDARRLPMAGFGQAGAAVFAWGLGTSAGHLAGLLQLTLLALTQSAVLLARDGGLGRLAALAGLAGVPPFGMFCSLALILSATARGSPWLLLPLIAGLGLLGWPILARLPPLSLAPAPARRQLAPQLVWIPLLLLATGFAMPHAVAAWLRAAATGGAP